jgi:drug/metabolite transporter (DMT)-like permease
MITFIAVVFRILVNPLSNVFQKQICRNRQSPLFANFLTYLVLSVVVFPFACFISWATFPIIFWLYFAMIGLLGASSNAFLVRAINSGELSVLGPINAYKSVIGIIFAFIFLAEVPSLAGLLGVFFIVCGSYFVIDIDSSSGNFIRKFLSRSDLRDRIMAIILTTVEIIFIKKIILYSNVQTAFIVWCTSGTFFAFLIILLLERDKKFSWKLEYNRAYSQSLQYLGLVLSAGLTQAITVYIFAHLYVGYALALFQLSTVLSVFYGWLFFNEKQICRKLAASVIMVIGSVLIILFGQ